MVNPRSDQSAGRFFCLAFGADVADPSLHEIQKTFTARGASFFAVVSHGQGDPNLLLDPDGALAQAFGVDRYPTFFLVAPNGHLAYRGASASGLQEAFTTHHERYHRSGLDNHPPVLLVPDVLSSADCQKLITLYAMQGNVFVEPGHGVPGHVQGDYKMRIPEYGRGDRIDHWIMQPSTNAFIDERLKTRLFPEIARAFHYRVTRREGYRIGCYEGERGGELHGHRDDSSPRTAHRRFACSINLNSEDFSGGELRFPEFGPHLYKPASGAAIVFSSRLLHEPLHVTRGRRFVLLAFLYGES